VFFTQVEDPRRFGHRHTAVPQGRRPICRQARLPWSGTNRFLSEFDDPPEFNQQLTGCLQTGDGGIDLVGNGLQEKVPAQV